MLHVLLLPSKAKSLLMFVRIIIRLHNSGKTEFRTIEITFLIIRSHKNEKK